jgi:hypothetical protein
MDEIADLPAISEGRYRSACRCVEHFYARIVGTSNHMHTEDT